MYELKKSLQSVIPHLKSVSVEPAAFFLLASILSNYMVYQNFIMERMCTIELNRTQEDCIAIITQTGNDSALEQELQVYTAKSRMYRSIVDHSVPLLLVVCLGYWSDSHGRKFPILLASFAPVAQAISLIIFTNISSMGGFAVGFGSSIVRSLCGAEVVFAMGAYSYLVDRTSDVDVTRTVRIGMLSAGYTLGVPAGISLGGLFLKLGMDYQTCFAISGGIGLLGVLLILFLVDNKVVNQSSEKDQSSSLIMSVRNTVVDYVTVVFKKRDERDRMKIVFLILAFICTIAPIHGEFGIFYNFVRIRLGWDGPQFGEFTTYKFLVGIAGVVLSMGIFSYGLKLPDAVVGFIAGLSQFGGCVIYAIANTSFLMYLAPAVDAMNGTMVVIARSMLSKLVEPSEVGKLFSVLSILEIVVPLFFDPFFSFLYSKTVHVFAGSVFVLSAVLTIPPQSVFGVMMFIKQKKDTSLKSQTTEGQKQNPKSYEDLQGHQGVYNPAFVHELTEDSCTIAKQSSV